MDNLYDKISNLEGSVDMAKLVYSTTVEAPSGKCTYKADFVRIKYFLIFSSNSGMQGGNYYIDIPRGCTGSLTEVSTALIINYNNSGMISMTIKGSLSNITLHLEFYNY